MIVVLFLFVVSFAVAGGGSVYSRFGIGDLLFATVEKTGGMGVLGFGLFDPISINRYNPSLWSEITRVRLSGSYFYRGISTTDGKNSAYLTQGSFYDVFMALPMWKKYGFTVAFGVVPLSTVNYDVKVPVETGGRQFYLSYTGEGGISEFVFGFSFKPYRKLSIGFRGDYYFGKVINKWEANFQSNEYFFTNITRERSFGGLGITFGFAYGLGVNKGDVTVGGAVSFPVNLNVISEQKYFLSDGTENYSIDSAKAYLPLRVGFGMSVLAGERLQVAGDVYYQNWGKFKFAGVHPDEIVDALRVGVGFEILPSREIVAGFFEKTSYRLGFFYNKTYLKIQNKSLTEIFFTAGFGFPISFDTRLNIAFEYGVRGKTADGLVRDKIYKLSLNVNTGEIWFVKRKLED